MEVIRLCYVKFVVSHPGITDLWMSIGGNMQVCGIKFYMCIWNALYRTPSWSLDLTHLIAISWENSTFLPFWQKLHSFGMTILLRLLHKFEIYTFSNILPLELPPTVAERHHQPLALSCRTLDGGAPPCLTREKEVSWHPVTKKWSL